MTRETRTRLSSGGHALGATVALPRHGEGPFPGVLLISGSGPMDRDTNHRRIRLDISRQLAAALAEAGLASLRYDKRGVGESAGAGGRNAWRRVGFHDNADDAEAAVRALAGRPDVDPGRVFVLGHSEGAVIATALSARDLPLAGLVLLSPAARSGERVLRWQAQAIVPTLPAPVPTLLRVLRVDPVAKVAANHAKIRATTTDEARLGGAKVNARWFREYMAYDPRDDLAKIEVPVLAITGSKDLQVDPGDLAEIEQLVPGPVETHVVPDVSHILRTQHGGPSLRSYAKDARRPVDERVVRLTVGWLAARARAGTGERPGEGAGPGWAQA